MIYKDFYTKGTFENTFQKLFSIKLSSDLKGLVENPISIFVLQAKSF
jgi:hypothetical protein